MENLCAYAQRDLAALREDDDPDAANREARRWCLGVNAIEHSEICAVPQVHLETELKVLQPRLSPAATQLNRAGAPLRDGTVSSGRL